MAIAEKIYERARQLPTDKGKYSVIPLPDHWHRNVLKLRSNG